MKKKTCYKSLAALSFNFNVLQNETDKAKIDDSLKWSFS